MESNNLLVKGDFSGIQGFIFNTSSKGAAKTLKSKSFYIQILSELAIKCILFKVGIKDKDTTDHVIYNSGGNFYLLIPENKTEELKEAELRIQNDLINEGLILNISYIEYDKSISYGSNLKKINLEAKKKALNSFSTISNTQNFGKFFYANQFEIKSQEKWGTMAKEMLKKNNHTYQISFFSQDFKFREYPTFLESVNFRVPKWTPQLVQFIGKTEFYDNLSEEEQKDIDKADGVIPYSCLGYFAEQRTGTANLGIFKLDVDGLGTIVRDNIDTIEDSKALAAEMVKFFDKQLKSLIEEGSFNINNKSYSYKDNLGVIFSGGDDCFIIGAWDAIFFFSITLKQEFDAYFSKLDTTNSLYKVLRPLTFSAGLAFVPPTFPVSNFSALAEEALEKSKHKEGKNALTVFDYTISWKQWSKIGKEFDSIYNDLTKEQYKLPRSILARLKRTVDVYDNMVDGNQSFQITLLTRFIYELKAENIATQFVKRIKSLYKDYLAEALKNPKDREQLLILPIVARLLEFATRKSKNRNGKKTEF